MPKNKVGTSFSHLIDSASEDDFNRSQSEAPMTPDSAAENKAPTKKARGRPKGTTNKAPASKASTRRTSGASVRAGKKKGAAKKPASKRGALKEMANEQQASDTEEVDEFDGQEDEEPRDDASMDELDVSAIASKAPAKKGRPPKSKQGLDPVKGSSAGESPGSFSQTKSAPKASSVNKKPAATKRKVGAQPVKEEKIIPETQPMAMDVDDTAGIEEDTIVPIARPVERSNRPPRAESKQRQPAAARRRAGSASDTERGSDPALRRRLGEMTKKFESLDLKYRNLRDVGVKEAEANFDKLKKRSEENAKAANEIIASLKKELAAQTTVAQETKSLRKQLQDRDTEMENLKSQVSQLSSDLSEAQNENKSLSTKLSANRAAASSVQSSNVRTPGSAVKSNGAGRTIMVGSAEAANAAQIAQLKEDLYSDLTNLIIRDVQRGEDADVYDCIQTGRNGTIHFKLAVSNEGESYKETKFQYMPKFDSNRDRDLLELLPDYLTEEIEFARMHADRFYSRVVDTMTKKFVEE
ncbi:MAG: hypothetical protein M1819_003180 [Sarea resinae]|nr:MAG: hypothetical protein M1819_003180 [Sarea resinae]